MQALFLGIGLSLIALNVAAADEHSVNAAIYEQWTCSEVAFWRVEQLKREPPLLVRQALHGEPQCERVARELVMLSGAHFTSSVEFVLPLSAATVAEVGYGVHLYLPVTLEEEGPVH